MPTSNPSKPTIAPPPSPYKDTTGYQFIHTTTGEPLTALYKRIYEHALDLAAATISPAEWPPLVIYLVRCLEAQAPNASCLESALDDICRMIGQRLNKGEW